MNVQEQAWGTEELGIQTVKLERLGGEQLRLSWHPPVTVGKATIYRSDSPYLIEEDAHLIAVVTQARELTFADPKPYVRGYFFVKFEDGRSVRVAERVVPLKGALNFRDMGGYRAGDGRSVKWGKLFRSADLSRLTEEDLAYLASLQLAWICDLRSDAELAVSPSPPIGSAVNEQLSFLASANPEEMMSAQSLTVDILAHMNRGMVGNTALTAEYFRRLLQREGAPTLFHCAAGKDRTGFIASVVLQALGVDRDTILEDYAMTNDFSERFRSAMIGSAQAEQHSAMLAKLPSEVIEALMAAKPAYLAASFEEIDARYGSFEGYWRQGLGLSAEELELLRGYYLE
ncbi:tyrosine-protein phosphatase [Paenibacillus soyae]|uniref:Tyrosine-protein phosphatase n=1 Tax=Paenibacillus soyae TaxID=2969249 RepID=A0A9X2SDD9_9BACL|nr:tyrosine-protein phosphatase [Paenibacillus soyae]MCR2807773.1 tyrosine-protein phosphatase [Paenibacillus soyae]